MHSSELIETNLYREKERTLFYGFIWSAIFLFPKTIAVILSNSVVLLADLLKSISKCIASLASWLSIRRVAKGKDFSYNFGYGKLENLTSLVLAGVLIISLLVIGYEVYHRFLHPEHINDFGVWFGLLIVSAKFVIDVYFWHHDRHLAKIDNSPIMVSHWKFYRADAIANGVVILSLIISVVFKNISGIRYVDPIGSIIIAGFLLSSAYGIVSKSLYDLLDGTLEESLQLVILRELAAFFDDYKEFHGIRSRRSGSHLFIDIFLEFDTEKKMGEIYQTIEKIRIRIEKSIPGSNVTITPTRIPFV